MIAAALVSHPRSPTLVDSRRTFEKVLRRGPEPHYRDPLYAN